MYIRFKSTHEHTYNLLEWEHAQLPSKSKFYVVAGHIRS